MPRPQTDLPVPAVVAATVAGDLRAILESITDGFFACDGDWRFIYVNQNAGRLTGLEPGEVIGRTFWEVFPDTIGTRLETEYRRAAAGEVRDFENYYAPWDRWFYNRCFPRQGGGIAVYFHDLTDRKRAQDLLQRTHDTFNHLIQNNPFGVYVIDADFKLRQASLGTRQVFAGISPLLGRDFAEILRIVWSEPFATEAIEIFRHTLETGEPYTSPSTVALRQNIAAVESYDWRIERLLLPDGRPGVVCYFYDLSERQRWESAVRESEQRFRELAEVMPQLVWTASADGRVDYYNAQVSRYDGFHHVDEAKWDWMPALHPDDIARTAAVWRRAVERGEPYEIEHRVRMRDGTYHWHVSRAQPSRDANGAVARWFGTATDIHEQKLAQELLERLVSERTVSLSATVAELEHFSYTITHDMRAPLRAMQSFAQILAEDYAPHLDATGRDYLRRITAAAERMDNLIRDSLNFSRAIRTELPLERIAPATLLRGLLESYPQFHPPQADIRIEGELPAVQANPSGLVQCFSNLIGNAVKFIHAGTTPSVRVNAERRGERVRIWIEDNGIGIEPGERERIFLLFQRASPHYEGTGVGLALVRKVAEQMHGAVGFEAGADGGTRFWLDLLAADAEPPATT